MINFSNLKTLVTPKGIVTKIESNGKILWKRSGIGYVSLGDSIAAGHTINDRWEVDYGEGSQYGKNGNTFTTIVPNCYTNLIENELAVNDYKTLSFARSGDKVSDLMEKLSHDTVQDAIKEAEVVTLCIGANDILSHVYPELEPYITSGDLSPLETKVKQSLNVLNTDSEPNSYISLFNKLNEINPNANYIFTTVYNPYKYLWIDESTNGFFAPLLNTIPQMNIDIDGAIEDLFNIDDLGYYDVTKFKWVSIELNYDLDEAIKQGLLNTPIIQLLFDRVNGLGDWVEHYIEGNTNFNGLNKILRNKINNYKSISPNFFVSETKALFDTYPDRPIPANKHYNDLVSVEFTRGYDVSKMDWGALWRSDYGDNVGQYWGDLAWKHIHYASYERVLELILNRSTNVSDYISFDINGFASELVDQIIEKVIVANIDPHPETFGHEVLRTSFKNVSEAWENL